MFCTVSLSNKCRSFELFKKNAEKYIAVSSKEYVVEQLSSTLLMVRNVSWTLTQQHIRMISEGSCDSEDAKNSGLLTIYYIQTIKFLNIST